MVVLASILFVTGCALILCFLFLYYGCQKQLVLVAGRVRELVDRKMREANAADANLVQQVTAGKGLGESIHRWQSERAAILETGKTKDPWRWTSDDLNQWMREQISDMTEGIRRKYLVATVVTAVCAVLIAGSVCLVYYQYYAAQQPGGNSQSIVDAAPESMPESMPGSMPGSTPGLMPGLIPGSMPVGNSTSSTSTPAANSSNTPAALQPPDDISGLLAP